MQSISLFFDIFADLLIFTEKLLMSAEVKGCLLFWDLLYVRFKCAKFHHCRMCVTDFTLPHPPSVSSPEKAHPE